MSRPTRPPGPPYPMSVRRALSATSRTRMPASRHRRRRRAASVYPSTGTAAAPYSAPARSPASRRGPPTGPELLPPRHPAPSPAPRSPARRSRRHPPRDAPVQPTFTPEPRGGRHGGRPRPSFTPREGIPAGRTAGGATPPRRRRRSSRPRRPGTSRCRSRRSTAIRPPRPRASPRSSARTSRTTRTTAPGSSSGPSAARCRQPDRSGPPTTPRPTWPGRARRWRSARSRPGEPGSCARSCSWSPSARRPLADAYNNSNTLPNTVYYLMLGGIFTAVVVPMLVRAAKEDPDRGEGYAERIFTLGVVSLLVVTVVATLLSARWSTCTRGASTARRGLRLRRAAAAPPHGDLRLLLHPADLLLRDGLAARRDPEHPGPVRRQHVDAGHQQRRGDHRRRAVLSS